MTMVSDLTERQAGCSRRARLNYFAAYVAFAIAVIASATAAIVVAIGTDSRVPVAILAALPGIVVGAMSTFRFESRADWWYRKYHGMDGFIRALTYEGKSDAEVSRELTDFLTKLEAVWPSFGKAPS
jgi:hypothetical protein